MGIHWVCFSHCTQVILLQQQVRKFLEYILFIMGFFPQGLSDVTFDLQASIPPRRQGYGIGWVHVSFVDDDIAQEGVEHAVLRMSLNSSSIPPAGSFIDSDLELTIYDMDCKFNSPPQMGGYLPWFPFSTPSRVVKLVFMLSILLRDLTSL